MKKKKDIFKDLRSQALNKTFDEVRHTARVPFEIVCPFCGEKIQGTMRLVQYHWAQNAVDVSTAGTHQCHDITLTFEEFHRRVDEKLLWGNEVSA